MQEHIALKLFSSARSPYVALTKSASWRKATELGIQYLTKLQFGSIVCSSWKLAAFMTSTCSLRQTASNSERTCPAMHAIDSMCGYIGVCRPNANENSPRRTSSQISTRPLLALTAAAFVFD